MYEQPRRDRPLTCLATRSRGRRKARPTIERLDGRLLLAASIVEVSLPPGWDGINPTQINNQGDAAGWLFSGENGAFHAFLFRNGVTTDLSGSLGGNHDIVAGINDSDQIAGTSYNEAEQDYHGFIYSEGTVTDLGVVPDSTWPGVVGINNQGDVPINFLADTAHLRAFVWSQGSMKSLGTLPGDDFSYSAAVNNHGEVVGASLGRSFGGSRAFLSSDGKMIDLDADLPPETHTLHGRAYVYSHSVDINDRGQVLIAGGRKVYLWTPMIANGTSGTVTELPTPAGPPGTSFTGSGLNDSGQVIGLQSDHKTVYQWLLYSNGRMIDPNSLLAPGSGWVIRVVTAINDHGQMVGTGLHNGVAAAFLMTPEAPTVSLSPNGFAFTSQTFAIPGSFTDPGTTEGWTATVDYGDGTGIQPLAINPDETFVLSHAYLQPGQYQVMVSIVGGGGGVGMASVTMTVTPSVSGFGAGRDAFVTSLYSSQLDRGPDSAGLTYWARGLAAGWNPWCVAASIWKSPEHRAGLQRQPVPRTELRHSYRLALQAWRAAVQPQHSRPARARRLEVQICTHNR